jgi:hypothetical protein
MDRMTSNVATVAATDAEEADEMRREKMIKFMADDTYMAKVKHE